MDSSSPVVPLEIRQVRNALIAEFEEHIPADRSRNFLSHALAAKAVQILTGQSTIEAVRSVTDGRDDLGIDAVGYSASTQELWLIQAKWSDTGTARFTENAASTLLYGLKTLDNLQFDRANARLQGFADRIRSVFTDPDGKVHLVAAIMGEPKVSRSFRDQIESITSELSRPVDFKILSSADFHVAVRDFLKPDRTRITATFSQGWLTHELPYRAFVGTVQGEEIARWYRDHGPTLMARNIRSSLGSNDVANSLRTSPLQSPENFWYYNNGITVTCDSVKLEYFATRALGHPVRLHLVNATVVNGTQTMTALHHLLENNPESLLNVQLLLRIVTTEEAPAGFVESIASANNLQHRIEPRDLVSLDEIQIRIRNEFRSQLNKEYVTRRGHLEPAPENGCTLEEAAVALACAHSDSSIISRTIGRPEILWQSAPDGVYGQLFSNQLSALQVWNSVSLLRTVRETLHRLSSRLRGRAASIADSGALLVAHIVFQQISIDDLSVDWTPDQAELRDEITKALALLINSVNVHFGQTSFVSGIFADSIRCTQLALATLSAINDPIPDLQLADTPPRRRRIPPVRALISQKRITDGTKLSYLATPGEKQVVRDWIGENPERSSASWVNDARHPLIWAVDGQAYSPSALVMKIWRLAGWSDAPIAVNGSTRWALPNGRTLSDLAEELTHDRDV